MLKDLSNLVRDTGLPVNEILPELLLALKGGRNAVLEASPGAGKTTIVPLALLGESRLGQKRILMLEPRRLAARAAASRMAELLGERTGETVGYRTRLDSSVGPRTRIEVVTEGILTRLIQDDPSLEGTGIVIFDEFHERSVHADLGLALTLECQSALREDLQILVMSATLDGREIASLLGGAPVIRSFGASYPVATRYLPGTLRPERADTETGPDFVKKVASAVLSALREETGSVLVFLPGSGEIKRVEGALMEKKPTPDVDIVPLYGDLSREAQDQAIRPPPPGRRKVVLATSIAETSLTIDGIRVVIDSGLKRVPRFSPATGLSRLETVRVTKDSAAQRCGRAGRLAPGVCLRLWPEHMNAALKERATPEILEADLLPLALELSVWGAADPEKLRWLDPPPKGGLSQARELLFRLGAVGHDSSATAHGREMARLPLHPRLAHMVIRGNSIGLGALACHIAAFLTERDFLKDERDPDLRHRLELLSGGARGGTHTIDRGAFERVKAAARQLERALGIKGKPGDPDKAGLLLAFAYPDRIGKRRGGGGADRYLLANGRGALLPPSTASEEYIVAASLEGGERESRVFLAAPFPGPWLEEYFTDQIEAIDIIDWDQQEKCVIARAEKRLSALVLSERQIKNPDREMVLTALIKGIRQNGIGALPWDRHSEGLRSRINFLNRVADLTGAVFPDLSDEKLLGSLEEWLGPFASGMTRLEHLKGIDMKAAILGMLSWDERESLDRLAPAHIVVPSGSKITINYSGERPVLAVRLQEMFGLASTPTIAGGKIKLLLHLLSPAGRPMQVTDDLAGFWTSSYQLVKKELRGRYPKHHWPDDPMIAEPSRGAKRKK
ncbi:MAG: ATP-dependent helicase HrpB [Deltaproteobacteria bacterium]|nr:ATP-dependent helicase HrpB [Deltaproteobacteria bacterium]MBZ0219772.1 ATP-dependent helicase HrpB [Deltaproteobacteria bacterium]